MASPAGTLVDTSVWVQFFRFAQSREALHLDGLLQARAVCTCAPIQAEVLSGTRTERERAHLRELFRAVPVLDPPQDVWQQAEDARFALARRGYSASLIDLMIACIAATHRAALWTLDDDFPPIRHAISFPKYIPEFNE